MLRLLLLGSLFLTAAGTGFPQSTGTPWPQLFGAARNGIAASPIPPGASLSVAWKKPMPSGGAGVVVAAGQVYTLGTHDERDTLFAFDASTGEEAWRFPLSPTHADALTNGPNSTPVVSGDLIITVSTLCQLQAVNRQTQKVAWTQDLGGTYGSRFVKRGGCGMSPLLAGDRIVIHTGAPKSARLVAFEAASGKPVWTADDLPDPSSLDPGWTPAGGGHILYRHSKPPGVSGITAVKADTGTIAWQIDGKEGESDVTPVTIGEDRVLVENWPHVSLYDTAARIPLWTTKEISAQRAPAVSRDGHIYTFGGQSGEFLTCVETATGKVKWASRIYRGHLALAGETLVVLAESSGLLRLVAADPEEYRELARVRVFAPGARTGTPPSIGEGRIFVRNLEEIVAVAVR
jgi:outer membrane protein assembly factor BamB